MDHVTSFAAGHAWRQYQGELRGFFAQRSGSAGAADDLLQEVFLRALMQGQDFSRIDNQRAWLFRVARNLLVDRLRLRKEQVPLPDDLCADTETEMGSDSDLAPVDVLSHCLPRVLSELSADDRQAITLCDLQGLTQSDYARLLGLSLAAAKSRVQRARRRLQAQLISACQVSFDDTGRVCCFVPRAPLDGTGV
jgi:RNA polymerase sigma-70 factor (ECF subfamily)